MLAIFPSIAAGKRDNISQISQTGSPAKPINYDLPFGAGGIFLPSNADSSNHEFILARTFPRAQYCRHCHEATYHQWRESLHSNSFREPFYKKNVDLLIENKGIAYTRHCEGCHNPIALLSGALTSHPAKADRSFDKDGITCSVCHSIQQLQPAYGLASYVMGVPAAIVDAHGNPIPGEVPYRMILEHPDRHVQAVMKPFYRSPEFCGTCHKANLPRMLNGYQWLRAFDTWDEWQKSSFSHRSPLPFYTREYAACQTCHMPEVRVHRPDSASVQGVLSSHRWLGGNTGVPFYYGYREQLQEAERFLRDGKLHVDIFAIRKIETDKSDDPWIAPLNTSPFPVEPGEAVEVALVIQNRGLGHSLVPEQRDIFEAWVNFRVEDGRGRVIAESGRPGKGGFLDPRAHGFVTKMLDSRGSLLVRHEVWLRQTVESDATIPSGNSVVVCYRFSIPKAASGQLHISAKVMYRHFNEAFTRFVLGEEHPRYPVVAMAADTEILALGKNDDRRTAPGAEPDWLRWNNFGIGLLNAKWYQDAATAFEHVIKLRPDYGDARSNRGLAYLEARQYSQADTEFAKALQLAPDNPRALYYRGVLSRARGDFLGSALDLLAVKGRYPDSQDVNRELGLTDYFLGKSDNSAAQFLRVQAEDPDDLVAHYYLALLYRRQGHLDLGAAEREQFSDENPFPNEFTNTLQILRGSAGMVDSPHPLYVHVLSTKCAGSEMQTSGGPAPINPETLGDTCGDTTAPIPARAGAAAH